MDNIIVYTTSTCPYCVMVKNFLTDNKIDFKEVNVENNPKAMQYVMNETGQMGVPQTEINGQWVVGFDPDNIMAVLQKQ